LLAWIVPVVATPEPVASSISVFAICPASVAAKGLLAAVNLPRLWP
jgi:hypothetical protein